jgi:hypothetical protein
MADKPIGKDATGYEILTDAMKALLNQGYTKMKQSNLRNSAKIPESLSQQTTER